MGAGEAKLAYASIACIETPKHAVTFALLAEDGRFETLEVAYAPPVDATLEVKKDAQDKFAKGVADIMLGIVQAEGVEVISTDDCWLVSRALTGAGFIHATKQPYGEIYVAYTNPTQEPVKFVRDPPAVLAGNAAANMLARHLAAKTN